MKIVCLSDTHGLHNQVQVPDGDILIFAGDCTSNGSLIDMWQFDNWLGNFPHKVKIVISGNHDFCFHDPLGKLENAIYLENSGIVYEGIKFWGFPYTPMFNNWTFMINPEEMKKMVKKIPDNIDILISHGPPFHILDTDGKGYMGCRELAEGLKRVKPDKHIFGHIHEAYGQIWKENTYYINCSICDENYMPVNDPVVIEI